MWNVFVKTVGTLCSVSDLDAWWVGGSTLGGRGRERDATTELGRHDISWKSGLAMQSWEIQSSADVEVFCITVNFIWTHMTATEQLSGRRCHVKLCWGRTPNTKGWKWLDSNLVKQELVEKSKPLTLTSPVVSVSEGHLTKDLIYCHVRWHLMNDVTPVHTNHPWIVNRWSKNQKYSGLETRVSSCNGQYIC